MLRISALALATLALTATPALAQSSAAPTPGCQGKQVNDAAGDSANSVAPDQTGSPSSDIIGGWIAYDDDAGKATANVQVDNLTEGEIDAPYVAISWEFGFTTAAGPRFVRAYQDRTGTVKYTWGEPRAITDDQTQPRIGGDTTGELFPGDDGVIQIEIPLADTGAPAGSQLRALTIEVRQWISLPAAVPSTGLPIYSPAPIFDTASGRGAVTLGPCAAPAVEPPAVTPPSGPAVLDVKVTVPKLSARKLKRTKRFTVKLSGTATDLAATLRRGSRIVGTGRLAALDGSGKLTVKLRRKLKRGGYVLAFNGRTPAGQLAEGTIRVVVRR